MDFDAHAIERAAAAAGLDAMQALAKDYVGKIIQCFGAWIAIKKVEGLDTGIVISGQWVEAGELKEVAAVGWGDAIRQLPRFQIDRADFEGLPIFEFDFRAPQVPDGPHRLRFGDTWLLWKRAAISVPMEMLYRVNLSTGPRWE
jgi:hypothetical protein